MRIPEFVTIAAQAVAASIDLITFEGQALRVRAADVLAVQDLPSLPKSLVWPGARSIVFFGSHFIIVRGSKQTIDTAVDGALSPGAPAAGTVLSYVVLEDRKASGTAGGTLTGGAWQTRVLNTEAIDTDNLCTLAANQFTLEPGTWKIFGYATTGSVSRHQARLRNITTTTTALISTSMQGATSITSLSSFAGLVIFATAQTFELQHRSSITVATNGLGFPVTFDEDELYAIVVAQRTT